MKEKQTSISGIIFAIIIFALFGYAIGRVVNDNDIQATLKACSEVFIIDDILTLKHGVNYNTPCFDKPTICYHPSGENHTKTCKDDCCIYKLDTDEKFTVEDYKDCLKTVIICDELNEGENCFYNADDDDDDDEDKPEIGFLDGGKMIDFIEVGSPTLPLDTSLFIEGCVYRNLIVEINKPCKYKTTFNTAKEIITLSVDKKGNTKIKRNKKNK